jgi:hypothetical protein
MVDSFSLDSSSLDSSSMDSFSIRPRVVSAGAAR